MAHKCRKVMPTLSFFYPLINIKNQRAYYDRYHNDLVRNQHSSRISKQSRYKNILITWIQVSSDNMYYSLTLTDGL